MKQFAVIGLGRFGISVAKTLYEMGHDVLAIDKNEELISAISDYTTHAVQGDASEEGVLQSLGIKNFDVAVVAIGGDIEASIMVTMIVKELGVKYVLAKAQNDMHARVLYKIGADRVVFPERDMGIRVAHNLVSTNIMDYIELSPNYSLMELSVLPIWVGKSLKELNMRTKYGINVIAIKRGESINVTPKADDVLRKGDVLIVVGTADDIGKLEALSGRVAG
ncbi:potassium channel family protein [Mahella australiensis]|uniref:TrkA-N domain protein n=1 Tax=Mahella australiensis (strain DSM 15567 / CIP 107919 / 50-1 BON) TaxID=697281 RepID=F4A082_MAHA5|nr:TrkA family potassium uptake protein [Mahella australiensis]AEE96916.1 TrkA-N domain protein [Mahella australiensis 50-1 BON]